MSVEFQASRKTQIDRPIDNPAYGDLAVRTPISVLDIPWKRSIAWCLSEASSEQIAKMGTTCPQW